LPFSRLFGIWQQALQKFHPPGGLAAKNADCYNANEDAPAWRNHRGIVNSRQDNGGYDLLFCQQRKGEAKQ